MRESSPFSNILAISVLSLVGASPAIGQTPPSVTSKSDAQADDAGDAGTLRVQANIDRARAAYRDLEYMQCVELLAEVTSDVSATDAQLHQAHLLAGVTDVILERHVQARLHFVWVLKRRPDTSLPGHFPPKIRSFFQLVREEVEMMVVQRPAAVKAKKIQEAPDKTPEDTPTSKGEGLAREPRSSNVPPPTPTAASAEAEEEAEGGTSWLIVGGGLAAVGAVVVVAVVGAGAAGTYVVAGPRILPKTLDPIDAAGGS